MRSETKFTFRPRFIDWIFPSPTRQLEFPFRSGRSIIPCPGEGRREREIEGRDGGGGGEGDIKRGERGGAPVLSTITDESYGYEPTHLRTRGGGVEEPSALTGLGVDS